MDSIYVTKTFLPPEEEYHEYIKTIWKNHQLTNQGPLLREFEEKIRKRFELEHFQFVGNGTLALQLAIHALKLGGSEIITTPFSYVATTSAILWEHAEPVFVDIDPVTLCIDPAKIEEAITPRTRAILAVHVFGRPCDVEKIEAIAERHGLKVIYDAAHAFGVKYKGKSLLQRGDVSICSFHATKVFHTIEGGGIVAKTKALNDVIDLEKRFGHTGDEHFTLGINAKGSEFHAAMGLSNLKYFTDIVAARRKIYTLYNRLLTDRFGPQYMPPDTEYNFAYYPLVLETESQLKKVVQSLASHNIFPRRYFYPSLNKLPYINNTQTCLVSEDIAKRIICLPMFVGLKDEEIKTITRIILESVGHARQN